MDTIHFYSTTEPYYEFSNFYSAQITVDNLTYPSTEYFYQAQKFMGPLSTLKDLAYAEQIRNVSTPNKAYYLARQIARGGYASKWYVSATDKTLLNDLIKQSKKDGVKPRSDWEIVKDNIMRKAVWAKFTQHQKLKELLLSTKALIVENSPRDSYWGNGKDGNGKNMLGKILVEVRTLLSGVFPSAPTVTSNWVVPEVILASAYPGAVDIKQHHAVVDAVMDSGVDLILSLQEPGEDDNMNSYRDVILPGFVASDDTFCQKIWSPRYKREIILARTPIPDQSVIGDSYLDALVNVFVNAVGKHYRLLIHCLGGKGRTGTFIGVMIGRMYGMTGEEALTTLKLTFESRIVKGNKKVKMPQTKVQFAQVRRLLSNTTTEQIKSCTEPPSVVCIKKAVLKKNGYADLEDWLNKSSDHLYIGRNMAFYVPGAVGSKWKNPFSLKKYSLEKALQLYEDHIRNTPELMNALPELGGKVLGCWCKPDGCHGDVLVKLYTEICKTGLETD